MARELDTKGYVKLYRKSLKKEAFKNAYAWQLFTYFLMNAKFSGDDIGTLETTQDAIKEDLNMSLPSIRKFMKFLKNNRCIEYQTVKGTGGKTIIKIVNFKKYQDVK